jgi:hypothetical protein
MAVWQLAPFFCYCAIAEIVSYFSQTDTKTADSPRSHNANAPWLKAAFALFGFFSVAMHLAVLWELASSQDLPVSHESTFISQHHKLGHPNTAASLYNEESRFFLQWDYIIIVIGAAIYVTVILDRRYAGFSNT